MICVVDDTPAILIDRQLIFSKKSMKNSNFASPYVTDHESDYYIDRENIDD